MPLCQVYQLSLTVVVYLKFEFYEYEYQIENELQMIVSNIDVMRYFKLNDISISKNKWYITYVFAANKYNA